MAVRINTYFTVTGILRCTKSMEENLDSFCAFTNYREGGEEEAAHVWILGWVGFFLPVRIAPLSLYLSFFYDQVARRAECDGADTAAPEPAAAVREPVGGCSGPWLPIPWPGHAGDQPKILKMVALVNNEQRGAVFRIRIRSRGSESSLKFHSRSGSSENLNANSDPPRIWMRIRAPQRKDYTLTIRKNN